MLEAMSLWMSTECLYLLGGHCVVLCFIVSLYVWVPFVGLMCFVPVLRLVSLCPCMCDCWVLICFGFLPGSHLLVANVDFFAWAGDRFDDLCTTILSLARRSQEQQPKSVLTSTPFKPSTGPQLHSRLSDSRCIGINHWIVTFLITWRVFSWCVYNLTTVNHLVTAS